jgi:tetratricopeptide (TPR) repeat protein
MFGIRTMRRAATVLLAVILTGWGGRAAAQDNVRETRMAAQAALTQGAFAEAIPLLEQLIEWLGSSTAPAIQAELEMVHYNLGLCYFLTGQFPGAHKAFATYLEKYRRGPHAAEIAVFNGDAYRFEQNLKDALPAYKKALETYQYDADWTADIHCSMAKCHLAQEQWKQAMPFLLEVYAKAPDFDRRNWAASLLAISYLKDRQLDPVYRMMPFLLRPGGFASRSVALNVTALEIGDELFGDEKYRDALWIYRIVYPRDVIEANAKAQLEHLTRRAGWLRKSPGRLRQLVRAQEGIGELEQELKALQEVKAYDVELAFRVARSYFETRRYRESRDLFYELYQNGPADRAEECLYLSFTSAGQLQPWDRAFTIGHEYLKVYEGSTNFYDTVSLTVGQMYANLQDWTNVIATLGHALQVHPKHEQVVECMFLIGYANFMEEKFPDSYGILKRMNQDYPKNDREMEGTYWTGMALLFDKLYEEALVYFNQLLADFPDSPFEEDATFRAGSCDFALSRFDVAEKKLRAFVQRWPESKLAGEAYVMLGDCGGTAGRLVEAVRDYLQILQHEVNIEQYNYALFRAAEMLQEMKDYDRAANLLRDYVARKRPGSNIPMALHGIAQALWQKGEQDQALSFYRAAVEQYGGDRKELGVDMLLDDWVGKVRAAEPAVARTQWLALRGLEEKALAAKNKTLSLRLRRVLIYSTELTEGEKGVLRQSLYLESNLPVASPGILELMLAEARRKGNQELVLKTARQIVADFPETDYGIEARMILGRDAVARGDIDEALRHLDIVREVFASSPEAGEALLLIGDLRRQREEWEPADECYNSVLGVKAWKHLWPAALYGRGESARARRKFAEASAYYERIYVLYSGHPAWCAKAYLARAECLYALRERVKALETLEEMLGLAELQQQPEIEAARKLQEKLKGISS